LEDIYNDVHALLAQQQAEMFDVVKDKTSLHLKDAPALAFEAVAA
jgi:hypothetical protein